LLAIIADTLIAANWQRANGKGQKPKPIPRPYKKARSPEEVKAEREVKIQEEQVLTQEEFDKAMFGV
jgi:hypothetical protein